MAKSMNPTPSHMGIFVTDMERMVQFYGEVLGLTVTNRGEGTTFKNELTFLSSDPEKHHQLSLALGRPEEATFSKVMQASLAVGSLDALRDTKAKALADGASEMRALDHGNAWSIYFKDPEGIRSRPISTARFTCLSRTAIRSTSARATRRSCKRQRLPAATIPASCCARSSCAGNPRL